LTVVERVDNVNAAKSSEKGTHMLPPFQNESFVDFTNERNAAVMREAIANVESQFGREYPVIIGGKRYTTGDMLASVNPSNYDEVIGLVHKANIELADKAIEALPRLLSPGKRCARSSSPLR
jgi:delta 1-pyrroline-5-carboxylate dehydrogenase